LFLRDAGSTEVGGFGVAATEDPLLVTDLALVEQHCSIVTVAFDDVAVAQYFDEQVDRGLHPAQFSRIWVHTHPGNCALPSLTDEKTFERVFGRTDWVVMFILACGGNTYCRLQYNRGPRGALEPEVEIDYSLPFAGSNQEDWEIEYRAKVHEWATLNLLNEPSVTEVRHAEDLIDAPARREQSPAIGGADDDYLFYEEGDWHDFCFD
jgi:hypothetical protein